MRVEELDQFIDRRGPDDCWPWRRGKTSGYGSVRIDGRTEYVHRLIYVRAYGDIPDGLVVDHRCHNEAASCPNNGACPHRSCQNPAHMQPATRGQNRANAPIAGVAALHAAKTHCLKGHALTGSNLKPNPKGVRVCRTCANKRTAEWTARVRAKGKVMTP